MEKINTIVPNSLKQNKIMQAVDEILQLEDQIKKAKETIREKKEKLNDVALKNPDDMTADLIGFLKYELGFPVTCFKSFDTRVDIDVPIYCECGKEEIITIRSKEKYQDYIKGKLLYMCPECKKKDEEQWNQHKKEYAEYINELKSMPYKEYLQTEHWKEFRKKVLKKYNNKCQLCGKEGILNVHHNNYEHRGEEGYDDVILLCQDCHAKFHNKLREVADDGRE